MIMLGRNITQSGDPLVKTEWPALISMIQQPDSALMSLINQLRTILTIDVQSYRRLKTSLPYFVCGIFNPPYRKSENFAHIDCFVMDIDHVKEKGMDKQMLKEKIKNDDRVFILFESPGGDGLKVIFRIKEKVYDRGKFSLFYKTFCLAFSAQYDLSQVLDARTSDVTRACFLSYDPDIYTNEAAQVIDIKSFLDFENDVMIKELEASFIDVPKIDPEPREEPKGDVLAHIRQTLNPKTLTKIQKPVYVPEEIERVIDSIRIELANHSVNIEEIGSIQYGKKIKVRVENYWAEINVFYGKKGFSVVKTPKNGSNSELSDIAWRIISDFFNGFENGNVF